MQDLNNQFSPNNLPENNLSSVSSEPLNIPSLPEKRKLTSALKVLIVIIVLLLVGVGAFGTVLYTRVYDPVWSPFRSKPEQVLQSMLQNMQNVKTVSSKLKINLSAEVQTNKAKVDIIAESVSDVTDKLKPKASVKANISLVGDMPESSGSMKGDMIVISKDMYVNISELNFPSFDIMFFMLGINPDQIKNVWIKIPQDFQNKINPETSSSLSSLSEEEMAKLTEKIQKIVLDGNVFFVKEQLQDSNVNGIKMYNYVVSVNNENLAKVIGEIMQESIKLQGNNNESLDYSSPYFIGAMKGAIQEVLNKVGEIKANVLIGKKDNMLYEINFQKTINFSDITMGQEQGIINISLQSTQSDFNRPVNITAPSSFKNIEEIFPIEEFLGSQSKVTPMPKLQYPNY